MARAAAELQYMSMTGTFRDRLKSAGLWEALGEKYDHLSTDEVRYAVHAHPL